MTAVVKVLGHWFLYGILILAGGGVMMLGKSDAALVRDVRSGIEDASVPFLETLSRPTDLLANGVEEFRHWLAVGDENARLREERIRLLQWEAIARRLHAENEELRKLLNLVPPPETDYVTARIVSDTAGMFAQSVLINAGRQNGVSKHDIVIADHGVVGRIIGVAESASRVLLVTDLNSRIPVLVGPLRTRAVLAGDNTDQPKLIHLPPNTSISAGDRIVTSGHGGVFPPGLPLGVVDAKSASRNRIIPYVSVEHIEFVRVADFDLGAIAADAFEPAAGNEQSAVDNVDPVPPETASPAL